MFTTYLQCKQTREGEKPVIRLARSRISYPWVFTPSVQDNEDGTKKERYSIQPVFPANADLAILKSVCHAVAAASFGADWQKKFPKLHMPWHNTTDLNKNGIPHYEKIGVDPDLFPAFVRCGSLKSFGAPLVVNHLGNAVKDESQVYPGRWALVSVAPYTYGEAKSMNKGVSLGFEGLQLLEDDEPLAARRMSAEQQFEPVEISGDASELFKGGA